MTRPRFMCRLNKISMMILVGLFANSTAANELPALGETSNKWSTELSYDNHIAYRGKDATGEKVGLSKFRNTLTLEAGKQVGKGWKFQSEVRGSFDGVYRMNADQFGNEAGGPIELESSILNTSVPHGQGTLRGLLGFNFDRSKNPNEGMRVLGDRWHPTGNGELAFGVPVRPCDVDSRGCRDFGGYGDLSQSELESPEFNKKLDFIREIHLSNTFQFDDGRSMFVKIGRQQVVWGRTDLFRVLDVINPIDYSRNNIYDELEDIRIPMFIAQAEYRMGPSKLLQDQNLQVVWNFDQFRPSNLGQCGQPNVILDAGCFFRGMANLWDNGGTVANFAFGNTATDFGPGQIGIRNVDLPEWKLRNTQLGLKFEGVTIGGNSFSLNALSYRSQLPSLHGLKTGAQNPFTTLPQTERNTHLVAFDVHYPRVNLIGGSMDMELESIGSALRLEGAMSSGEEFVNTAQPQLFSRHKVWRSVIGLDRQAFVPWINPLRTTLFSGQLFWQHIKDHEFYATGTRIDPNGNPNALGPVGMPDFKDNYIATLLIKAFLMGDRLSPELILARDFKARSHVIAPKVEYNVSNNLKITFGGNFKLGSNARNRFDDCRSCNPYAPFTSNPLNQAGGFSQGLASYEPLGRFRAGPIGTALYEDDVFFRMNYKF